MASKRAKEEENCISIFSNLVSKPTTFEAVSDILYIDISSAFSLVRGAKVTEWVGVVITVFNVLTEVFSFFFFRALLAVLRKVEMESESL
jgi:hypothetical protein